MSTPVEIKDVWLMGFTQRRGPRDAANEARARATLATWAKDTEDAAYWCAVALACDALTPHTPS